MTDKSLPDDDTAQTLQRMHGQQADQRREASRAFSAEQSRGLTTRDLQTDQVRQDRQLSRMEEELARLRRGVRSAQLFSGLLLLLLVAGSAVVWYRPDWLPLRTPDQQSSEANQKARRSYVPPTQELVFGEDLEFKIRTDVDRKYQRLVRDLNARVEVIRFPDEEIEDRMMATDYYLDVTITALSLLEQASTEGVSSELTTAIINILEISKAKRRVRRSLELDPSIRDRMDQVQRVIQATDARRSFEPSLP